MTTLSVILSQFEQWYQEAIERQERDPDAMALATVDSEDQPSVRVVLYKGLLDEGLVFYTNYESQKGGDIEKNPKVALSFYWPLSYRQVRFQGILTRLSYEVSNRYFCSRPPLSQISAWASPQSQEIPDRHYLESRYQSFQKKFETEPLQCPPFWGGYVLHPTKIEFWQGKDHRLHERTRYTLVGRDWKKSLLAP